MAQTAEGNALTAEQRNRMHNGKKRFAKEGAAIAWVVSRQQRGTFLQGRVYKCPVCVGYHVSPQPAAAAPAELRLVR